VTYDWVSWLCLVIAIAAAASVGALLHVMERRRLARKEEEAWLDEVVAAHEEKRDQPRRVHKVAGRRVMGRSFSMDDVAAMSEEDF
jgi:hypothetical protein